CGKIPLVDAVVGLEPPDRGDDRARHAEALLDALERAGELLELARADAHAVGRDHARGELLEGLAEHALAPVARDYVLVVADALERGERARRDAVARRLAREALEPRLEAAAARHRRVRGRGGGREHGGEGEEARA